MKISVQAIYDMITNLPRHPAILEHSVFESFIYDEDLSSRTFTNDFSETGKMHPKVVFKYDGDKWYLIQFGH